MMEQNVKENTLFSGDFGEDIETAKRLIATHPNVNLSQLMAIASDPQQPQSARIASIYTLGFTDDHGTSRAMLAGLINDPDAAIRDHAAEALESITPHH
jgi:hypothetical protein